MDFNSVIIGSRKNVNVEHLLWAVLIVHSICAHYAIISKQEHNLAIFVG